MHICEATTLQFLPKVDGPTFTGSLAVEVANVLLPVLEPNYVPTVGHLHPYLCGRGTEERGESLGPGRPQ